MKLEIAMQTLKDVWQKVFVTLDSAKPLRTDKKVYKNNSRTLYLQRNNSTAEIYTPLKAIPLIDVRQRL
jgi:hypothetical protein